MLGKEPKERARYVLRMRDGTTVEVDRGIYLEWYQSRRREKYQLERSRSHGECSLDALEAAGVQAVAVKDSLEETVARELCREKVRKAMEGLPQEEAELIRLLYFAEASVTEAARAFGCSCRTIRNCRDRILRKLRFRVRRLGLQGGSF